VEKKVQKIRAFRWIVTLNKLNLCEMGFIIDFLQFFFYLVQFLVLSLCSFELALDIQEFHLHCLQLF